MSQVWLCKEMVFILLPLNRVKGHEIPTDLNPGQLITFLAILKYPLPYCHTDTGG